MRRPPAWALASSLSAPIALIGGWTIAAHLQPGGFDQTRDTISALARHGAAHREVMTAGLALLGLAHIVTAAGLREIRPAARALQALAGAATVGVAVFALPDHGSSAVHVAFATTGFVALALWPITTGRRSDAPTTLKPLTATAVTVVSLALLAWVATGGPLLGLAERLCAGQQALWPLAVVLSLRARRGLAGSNP